MSVAEKIARMGTMLPKSVRHPPAYSVYSAYCKDTEFTIKRAYSNGRLLISHEKHRKSFYPSVIFRLQLSKHWSKHAMTRLKDLENVICVVRWDDSVRGVKFPSYEFKQPRPRPKW